MANVHVLVLGATPENPAPGLPNEGDGVVFDFASTLEETRALLPQADAVYLWEWHTPLLKEAWPVASRLRWVHVIGVGIEWALFPELVASDVIVTNTRGVYDTALSEYVVALMLLMAKDLRVTIELQNQRRWDTRSTELLAGKRLLIIGFGTIGRSIGRVARLLGMSVTILANRARRDAEFGDIHASDELLSRAPDVDYLILAVPSTPDTHEMLNARVLDHLPRSARVINVGRGDAVSANDLIDALSRGRIAGAALDVFSEEPLTADDPLWSAPNLIVSPHMSGIIPGWELLSVDIFRTTLRKWLGGEQLDNVVDKRRGYVIERL